MVPSATLGDAAVPATSASSTDASWLDLAGRRQHRPVDEQRAPVGEELGAGLARRGSRCSALDAAGRAQRLGRLERVEPRVGEVVDRAHLLDARAVDLLDLPDEQVERDRLAQQHRELVDGDVVAPFEHVDADDVAVHGTDAGGDETERAGTVGEPHPHEDVRGRLGGVAHGIDGTGRDDANVSPR